MEGPVVQGGVSRNLGGRDDVRSHNATEKWVPKSATKRDVPPIIENSDDVKFRTVRGILNKLTPQTFDKLTDELIRIGLDSQNILKGVILLIFEKALQEPKYVCMYAQLCKKLAKKVPNFDKPTPENTTTFRRLLLNKCQDEFENRARASAYFDQRTEKLTLEEEEEKLLAKRKMLGNINFIGELGKLEMLTHSILHKCCEELVKKTKAEDLECLSQIMGTCGHLLDNDKGKYLMDQYFARINELSNNEKLPPRIRFMLQGVLELRANHWLIRPTKTIKESPKPIEDIRKEASEELGLALPDSESMDYRPMNLVQGRPRNFNSKKKTGMEDVFGPVPFAMNTLGTGPGVITQGRGEKPHGLDPSGFQHPPPMNAFRPPGGMRPYNNNPNMMSGGPYYSQHNQMKQVGMRQNHFPNQHDHYMQGNNHHQARNNHNYYNNDVNVNNGFDKFEKTPVAPRFLKHGQYPLGPPMFGPQSPQPFTNSPMSKNELSLRPPPNSMIKMFPQPNTNAFSSLAISSENKSTPIATSIGTIKDSVPLAKENIEKPKSSPMVGSKGPTKDTFIKKVEANLEEYLNHKNIKEASQSLIELNIPPKFIVDVVASVLNKAMDHGETERELVYDLLVHLEKNEFMTHAQFLDSYRNTLDIMGDLEADIPRIKSYVAGFAAKAVSSGILNLVEISEPTENGNYYPFLLLVLQQLGKMMEKPKLSKLFGDSKINLLDTLPKVDRTKSRLADILEERELSFLFPLLKIQADMIKQLNGNQDADVFFTWIVENVDAEYQAFPGFVTSLMTVLFRFITQEALKNTDQSEKAIRDVEMKMLQSFKPTLTKFLQNKSDLQVIAIYAIQSCWYALECPKLVLLRWFVNLHELEMIEEEAFLKWKEDIRDDYPGKGKALFQVNQWLLWLEQAEEEEDDGEEHD